MSWLQLKPTSATNKNATARTCFFRWIRTELIRDRSHDPPNFLITWGRPGCCKTYKISVWLLFASEEFKCTLLLAVICTRLQWFLGSILHEKERKYILTTV